MGFTLYELNEQIEDLTERMIDPETGEVDEEIMNQIDLLKMDVDAKLDAIGIVIKSLTGEIDIFTQEKKNLQKNIDSRMRKIERLCNYSNLVLKGKPKSLRHVQYSYHKSQKVQIVNEDMIPDKYMKFEMKSTPVKTEIKKALKNGENVPGCYLEDKNNLIVK